jgi:hypothetical protein
MRWFHRMGTLVPACWIANAKTARRVADAQYLTRVRMRHHLHITPPFLGRPSNFYTPYSKSIYISFIRSILYKLFISLPQVQAFISRFGMLNNLCPSFCSVCPSFSNSVQATKYVSFAHFSTRSFLFCPGRAL